MNSLQRLFGLKLRFNLSGYPFSSGIVALRHLVQAYGTSHQFRPYIWSECVASNRWVPLSQTVLKASAQKPTFGLAARQPPNVWVTLATEVALNYLPGRKREAPTSSPSYAWSDSVTSAANQRP